MAEAIVTVLYVLAERRGGGVLGPRELDAVHLRSSPLPAVGCVRKENGGHVTLDIGTTHNAIDAAAASRRHRGRDDEKDTARAPLRELVRPI